VGAPYHPVKGVGLGPEEGEGMEKLGSPFHR
jgi:hypothetical protein